MVVSDIQVISSDAYAALEAIFALPPPLRPTTQSVDERGHRVRLDEQNLLQQAKQGMLVAAYLWSDEASIELSAGGECLSIYAKSVRQYACLEILLAVSKLKIHFGFACDYEERSHRNRIAKDMSYGVQEGWVGRTFKHGLPGVYWVTILPDAERKKLGIAVEDLKHISQGNASLVGENWLLRLYENPGDWLDRKQEVDDWCEETSGVFYKGNAMRDLDRCADFMSVARVFDYWN